MEFQRKSKEKRFGVSYMGSKSRFWRWLLQRIPACGTFYDLFAGGCSVGHMMGYFGKCEKVVFNDVNAMPLELFRMAIDNELPPPTWMSHEEFRERNKAGDPLSLLFSFGANGCTYFCSNSVEPWQKELFQAEITGDYSFLSDIFRKFNVCGLPWAWGRERPDILNAAAKSFAPEGVAWTDKAYTTLCRSYPLRKRERLSRFDELPINLPIEFRNLDYRAAAEDADEDDVIYADPPYQGKSGYGVAFDNVEFWEWCRRPRRALLIISEYSAPPDFTEVWAKQVICAMSQKGEVGRPIERLFVHESQETLYWDMYGMPLLPLKFNDQQEEWRNSNTSRLFLSNFVNKKQMKIPELLRSLMGGILSRHRRTRLTFTTSAVDLTTYEYAAAIYSAMMDLILSAVKKTEWRLVSGGSFKWGALAVFLRCHADEIVAGMINEGTVSVRRDGDTWRFCEEQEEADYVFQSADWRIRNLSTYQIIQPALCYLNNIVNAANTSISRLGVLACFSPKQDEYGNTLTPEELEKEEARLQAEYGALSAQKVVKFFQHSYDLNVINIAGENLQLSDRFTQAIKMLCSKLKIPFELVPCAVLGNNNQTGVYQGEAVKRLYQTVAEWQSYIIDFCAAMGFKVEAINNDAPKDYEAEAEAVRSAALANLRAATEAGYISADEARAEYRSLIGL